MSSYESQANDKINNREELSDRLNISILKYFWQSNPITGGRVDNIPKFLRRIEVLKNFTDNELRILSQHMHYRKFDNREIIFKQGDIGIGFYLIYSGNVDVIVKSAMEMDSPISEKEGGNHLLSLEKYDYFGELALLQENSVRNATVIAREHCELIGIFKPDLEALIDTHSTIATKLLQSISVIISHRLFSLTKEVRELKYRLAQLEKQNESSR
jgi:CRP-like cAMP-binding protein